MRVEPVRRVLLKCAGLVALGVGPGLSASRAATDPLFDATLMADVLRAYGGMPAPSSAIDLELPELTENGAMVPITVTSRLPDTEQIVLLVESNPFPLVAQFAIAAGTEPFLATRVKLAQSGSVCAIVRAGGRYWSATKDTVVTLGGCGG